MPPHLAGRQTEKREFERLLEQTTILENLVLTGLRGLGKTVLLETFKPLAIQRGWLWVGADLSEAVSVSETALSIRLITDLSVVTSGMVLSTQLGGVGFVQSPSVQTLDYAYLSNLYDGTPGLVADKLKAVLETVAAVMARDGRRGLVFAYDEAQNLADAPAKDQYPLSLLLDVFQSIQKKDIPFMLALTGLPTLFPKLVEARTFAERMFRVVLLSKLSPAESRDAIVKPIEEEAEEIRFSPEFVDLICQQSGGYPYFIQFICREVFDAIIQQIETGRISAIPIDAIIRKLDTDFFAGRWAKATDRQRQLLWVVAQLGKPEAEFTVQEVVAASADFLAKPFGASHVNQILAVLCDVGLVYKNRWGRYSFAVPLFDRFILRQEAPSGPELPA
jgi:hypothetical protein